MPEGQWFALHFLHNIEDTVQYGYRSMSSGIMIATIKFCLVRGQDSTFSQIADVLELCVSQEYQMALFVSEMLQYNSTNLLDNAPK